MEFTKLYQHLSPGLELDVAGSSKSPFGAGTFNSLDQLLGCLDRRGITLRALHILIHLRNVGKDLKRLSELAGVVGLSSAGITGIADQLEEKGLAVRVVKRQDRRSIYLALTPEGARFVNWIAESLEPVSKV